jgi:formate hydrogenlyase transcriptional activator
LKRHSANLETLVEERTKRLLRSEERQRILLEINNAIIAKLDRRSLFEAVAGSLQQAVPFDGAAICLAEPENDTFQLFALETSSLSKWEFGVGQEFARQGSHVGWVLDHGRPLVRRDLTTEREFPVEDRLFAQGIRSYVVVPLVARGRAFGTLNVATRTANQYSLEEVSFLEEIAKQVSLAVENMWAFEEIAQLKARLEQKSLYLQEEIKTEHDFEEIVGRSRALKKVLKAVETVAPTDASVLILGETGTGKELIARALHNLSPRRDNTLVKVNCATLPAGLIEDELFGHEKGAFTGALTKKIGRFELANEGTIFLDEIGDLPLDLQVKLLRVLQEGEFERVGGAGTIKINVRIIAATNRDLEQAISEGKFRQDLFYRLNVFPIQLPPLRERKEDIPLLVRYFVMRHNAKLGKKVETVSEKTMAALSNYAWPGNVRELENVIERSVITSQGTQLDLGNWLQRSETGPIQKSIPTLLELEREHILRTLRLTGWKVSGERGAAQVLGLKPTTLEARMKKLGIKRVN